MPILETPYPVFKPSMRIISNITNDYPALVTTMFDHGYITGMIVRLIIPLGYGIVNLNKKYSNIIVTSPTTFTINLDTRNDGIYSTPTTSPDNLQYCQAVPIGEINSTLLAAVQNVLPY